MSRAVYDVFREKRVLVTGDTGFKGSWLSLWLTELGADVTGYALPAEGGQPLFDLLGLERDLEPLLAQENADLAAAGIERKVVERAHGERL